MPTKKGPVEGLTWLQLFAGAMAAMTSAWVASYLGVAGTIIGAAIGSLTAAIATALYSRGIDRGTTLITASGSVVSRPANEDRDDSDTANDVASGEPETIVVAPGATEPDRRPLPWRKIIAGAGAALVVALGGIVAFEFVTGQSFGDPSNPSIGRTVDDSPDDEPAAPSEPTTAATTTPTEAQTPTPATPTTAQPTETVPTTAAPAPSPTPAPEDGDSGGAASGGAVATG